MQLAAVMQVLLHLNLCICSFASVFVLFIKHLDKKQKENLSILSCSFRKTDSSILKVL